MLGRFVQARAARAVFFDMKHSNNAARVRLWLRLNPTVAADHVETRMVQYGDLASSGYKAICPTQKVPSLIREDGQGIYESSVILGYLEHKHNDNQTFVPKSPEERCDMELMIRLHDLYISSPNSTMPGVSHSQGAMYLAPYPTKFCPPRRCMDNETRAKKIQELYEQLCNLEALIPRQQGPFLVGKDLSLADLTWYPTTIFFEFMLPRVFGWKDVCRDSSHWPKFSAWWQHLTADPVFAGVRDEIMEYWHETNAKGQFESIQEVVQSTATDYQWKFPVDWTVPFQCKIHYQEAPTNGKRAGRYIHQPSQDDLVDEHVIKTVTIGNGRAISASLDSVGFALVEGPSTVLDRYNSGVGGASSDTIPLADPESRDEYYEEMKMLLKNHTGPPQRRRRIVECVDRTAAAAPALRAHCDYTSESAPLRLAQLIQDGTIPDHAVQPNRRYEFINVWRSYDNTNPFYHRPLAVCDATSVDPVKDRFVYQLKFPHRTGQTYSLRYNPQHRWYVFPQMTYEECLLFRVYGQEDDSFVFHTAVDDPRGGFKAPTRKSVEVRAICFF